MSQRWGAYGARKARCFFAVLVGALLCHGPADARADDDIVRVEEDWELVVGEPDANSAAPQITCAMSPVGDLDVLHAAIELNHQSLPEFVAGGLQLQVWSHDEAISTRKAPQKDVLRYTGETVRWTQQMRLEDGNLTFEVLNGASTTWGAFGGQGYLKATVTSNLDDLDDYDPEVSIKHSGVGYAANRVQSLRIKEIRWYTDEGLIRRDTTTRDVNLR